MSEMGWLGNARATYEVALQSCIVQLGKSVLLVSGCPTKIRRARSPRRDVRMRLPSRSPLVRCLVFAFIAAVFSFHEGIAIACPFCLAPSVTLRQQVEEADAAILARCVSRQDATGDSTPETVCEVVSVAHDVTSTVRKGQNVILHRPTTAEPGDLFLLLGTKGSPVEWNSPIRVSEAAFAYLSQSPRGAVTPVERLAYFAKSLESPDQTIADDAYGEFAGADYKDIVKLAHQLEAGTVREWIADPKTNSSRLGLYGLLLGLTGGPEDAAFLKQAIFAPLRAERLGTEGLIAGYLLLAKEDGLSVIEESRLKSRTCPFTETYAAVQAVEFLWTYGDGVVSKERLRAAMRSLLDHPQLAERAVTTAGRWNDWSILDRVMEISRREPSGESGVKRAVIRYCLIAESAERQSVDPPAPEQVKKAKSHLATLRREAPQAVADAEEFLFLNF